MSQQERKVTTWKLFRAQENTGDKATHGLSFKADFLDQLLSVVEKKKWSWITLNAQTKVLYAQNIVG